MKESLLLSKPELLELTGSRIKTKQTAWLKKNRWVFVLDVNERPHVARQYALMRLGVDIAMDIPALPPTPIKTQPNFAALG